MAVAAMVSPSGSRAGRRGKDRGLLSHLVLAVIVLLSCAAAGFAITQLRTDEVAEWLREQELLVGLTVVSDPRHEVAFEVLLIDPETRRAGLLFMPGNVGALISSRNRVDALESLYEEGAPDPLYDQIGELLGVRPRFHLDLTGARLADLVDLIGGAEVHVAEAVEAPPDGAPGSLPAGPVRLDGDKVAVYLSYRAAEEPHLQWAGRLHRLHQGILRELGRQPQMVGDRSVQRWLYRRLGTNLSAAGFATLLAALAQVDSERLIFQYTIGEPQTVDGRTLVFPHFDDDLLPEAVSQVVKALANEQADSTTRAAVEILNGTGVAGLARAATPLLQSFGYRVVRIANADHHEYAATQVFDHRGRPELAARVAELMQCPGAVAQPAAAAAAPEVEVTIVLGGDFNGRRCSE